MRSRRRGLIVAALLSPLLLEAVARLLPLGLPDRADVYLAWVTGRQPVFVRGGAGLTTAPELVAEGNSPVTFALRKAPGVVRVLCVGDSTTAGWPFNPTGAYPNWLSGVLADVRPDLRFEVINAGFHGFDSTRSLSVVREALAYQPDVVIFHGGYNDFQLARARASGVVSVHTRLAERLQTYNLLRWLAGRRGGSYTLQPPPPTLTDAQEQALVSRYLGNLAAMEADARAAGARVLLTDLPYSRKYDPRYGGWPALDEMRSGQRAVTARRGWALTAFPGLDEARFVDHIHCDEEGYRRIAVDVAKALERSGALPAGTWRWERLRGPEALARGVGLDRELMAHAHVRLASVCFARNDQDCSVKELAAALRAAPNPRLVPLEISTAGNAHLQGALDRAEKLVGR